MRLELGQGEKKEEGPSTLLCSTRVAKHNARVGDARRCVVLGLGQLEPDGDVDEGVRVPLALCHLDGTARNADVTRVQKYNMLLLVALTAQPCALSKEDHLVHLLWNDLSLL